MAVSDFSDLDLKLASAEVTLSTPNIPEIASLGNDLVDQAQLSMPQPTLPTENGEFPNFRNGFSSEVDVHTPVPISQQQQAQSPIPTQSSRGRKRGGSGMELAVVLDPSENPEWLPPGWKVVKRTRPSGKSAGSTDTYYREPINNRQFRSKKEVLEFMTTGVRRSHKKSENKEDNSSTSPLKITQPISFDSSNPPEKVRWVLGNSDGNLWTPFIGEDRVPEHIKLEWASMFNPFVHRNGGYRS